MNKDFDIWSKQDFIKEINRLQLLINEQDMEIKLFKEEHKHIQKLKNELNHKLSEIYWSKGRNERNAGRKPKINPDVIAKVKQYREKGLTYKQIAEEMGLSVGLVHKASQSNS